MHQLLQKFIYSLCMVVASVSLSGAAFAQAFNSQAEYIGPAFSSLTIRPHVVRVDDYSDDAKGLGLGFEQVILRQVYVSGNAYETAVSLDEFDDRLHVRDYQLGIGYFMPVQQRLFLDAAVTIGQHAKNLPGQGPLPDVDPDDEDAEPPVRETLFERSDYIGLRAQLRGNSGPFEGLLGAEYVYFNGNGADTEPRLFAALLFNLNRQIALGLRYQDNDSYNLTTAEIRIRF